MTTDDRILSGASSESSLPPNKSSGDIGELKPCPWCGSTASRVRIMSRDAIQCDGENCGVIKRTPDEWNTRAPDPESAAEIERLRRENVDKAKVWDAIAEKNAEIARLKAFLSDGGHETIQSEQAWKRRALTAESAVAAAWEEAAKIADERASREKRFQVACINNGDHARAGEHAQARVACDAIASAIRAAVSKKTGAESGHSSSTDNSESE